MNGSIAVVGLGNLIREDDGVGVHAIHRLQVDHRVPRGVVLIDGGTQGLSLLPYLSGFSRLLAIDAIHADLAPGTLIRMEGKECERMKGKPSVHQLGFADMLIAMQLLGDSPADVVLLGVQPGSTEWSGELSPPVRDALGLLTDLAIAQLEQWTKT